MVFLDTHAVVWLYAAELEKFGEKGLALLECESLYISPAVLLELEYLKEIGRINENGDTILSWLRERIGLETDPLSFLPVAERACRFIWTRDPFDRLIAAQADFHGAILISKDRTIAENYPRALW